MLSQSVSLCFIQYLLLWFFFYFKDGDYAIIVTRLSRTMNPVPWYLSVSFNLHDGAWLILCDSRTAEAIEAIVEYGSGEQNSCGECFWNDGWAARRCGWRFWIWASILSRGVTISGRIYCIIRCTAGSTTHTHEGLKIFDETWLLSFE